MNSSRKIPERMCVSCRKMVPKTQLIRLVAATNGTIVDLSGKSGGRGVYVCKCRECIDKLKKAKGLAKNYGIVVSDELFAQLENLIER